MAKPQREPHPVETDRQVRKLDRAFQQFLDTNSSGWIPDGSYAANSPGWRYTFQGGRLVSAVYDPTQRLTVVGKK